MLSQAIHYNIFFFLVFGQNEKIYLVITNCTQYEKYWVPTYLSMKYYLL